MIYRDFRLALQLIECRQFTFINLDIYFSESIDMMQKKFAFCQVLIFEIK